MGLAGHRCPAKAARIAAIEAAARPRLVGVRVLLTGWLDLASEPAPPPGSERDGGLT
jgi:hypothetical protein